VHSAYHKFIGPAPDYKYRHNFDSRDTSDRIALGYGLDDGGSSVRLPARAGNFSLHDRIQNGSGAHTASSPGGTGVAFPGLIAAGA